jgi:hypothetical protein
MNEPQQHGGLGIAERLARRARWTEAIAADDYAEIDAAFQAGGAQRPRSLWNPGLEDLQTEPCRFLHAYWHRLRGGGDSVSAADAIDPTAMRPALGYVLLLDAVEGGSDFRYRVYGSLVASVAAQDMSGRLMSDHHASDYVVDFTIASGRAGMKRRDPLWTMRYPARTEYTQAWERLQLPLAGPDGAITRLLVGNVPLDRAGDVLRPRY